MAATICSVSVARGAFLSGSSVDGKRTSLQANGARLKVQPLDYCTDPVKDAFAHRQRALLAVPQSCRRCLVDGVAPPPKLSRL